MRRKAIEQTCNNNGTTTTITITTVAATSNIHAQTSEDEDAFKVTRTLRLWPLLKHNDAAAPRRVVYDNIYIAHAPGNAGTKTDIFRAWKTFA